MDQKCVLTRDVKLPNITKESDKNSQTNVMWPVKPPIDVQLKKPAMKSGNKKSIGVNENCKATMSHKKQKKCENNDSKSQSFKCSDKNCQEVIHMQSVTMKSDVQLPKPVIRRLCKDKTCQSTRCYKSPVRPVCKYDKIKIII